MSTALELENVGLRRGARQILESVNLCVPTGMVLAITGPSGGGKSSLLRLIAGLERPSSGVVRINEEVASTAAGIHLAPERRGVALVTQDLGLWPHMSVHAHLSFALRRLRPEKQERQRRIAEMLREVGMEGREGQLPATLSGGERQRLAIARALAARPSLVLLDEPMSNLDIVLKGELITLFRNLFEQHRCTALYVSHDLQEMLKLTKSIAVVERGAIVQQGPIEQILDAPASAFVARLVQYKLNMASSSS
jgi:iron(III) transport system ATP-binding protein